MARTHRQFHCLRRAPGRPSSSRSRAKGGCNTHLIGGQPTVAHDSAASMAHDTAASAAHGSAASAAHDSAASTSGARLSGLSAGAYRLMGTPSLPMRNFVKFHLIPSVPRIPGTDFFKYSYNGCASGPLTLILANIGKLTP